MRPFSLPGSVLASLLALCVSSAMAQTAGKAVSRAEPPEAILPPVDPSWKATGWHPVVPHAFVLRKLLPVRTAPQPGAPVAFYLRGGTRVPVVDQGAKWWRISWTEARTGWVRVEDVEPHAAFVLIDTRTGRMVRRIAAKGQWGAVSDGTALWSVSNSGITRTLLGTRPSFWAKPVAADRDAIFPDWSIWDPARQQFFLRSQGAENGRLLQTDVRTGQVRTLGTPPAGELAGVAPDGAVVLTSITDRGPKTHLYAPAPKGTRETAGHVQAVTRSGVTFLTRGEELLRCDPQLRVTSRARLPNEAQAARLTADERYIAASCEPDQTQEEGPPQVWIFEAATLKRVRILTLPKDSYYLYLRGIGYWSGGWWIASGGEGQSELVARYRKDGRLLKSWEASSPMALSADGKQVFLTGERHLLALEPAAGRARKIPLQWRRSLPARYLPAPSSSDFPTHLDISSLTVSPDGRMLVLTEWLNGDPEG